MFSFSPKRGDSVLVFGGGRPGCQCSVGQGGRMSTTSGLLCGQDTFRCRNPLFEDRKIALALVTASRKLRAYFQAHQVVVLMN